MSVALIHMNGRMYDAKLGRFLSPDNYIQEPFNTQSFNRYGYVWNNPLKFTDPSGEWIWIVGAIIGAWIGGAEANGGNLNPFAWDWSSGATWGGILKGAAIGAVLGGAGDILAGGSFLGITQVSVGWSSAFGSVGLAIDQYGGTDFHWETAAGGDGSVTIKEGTTPAVSGDNVGNGGSEKIKDGTVSDHSSNSSNIQQYDNSWDLNKDGILQKYEADSWWLSGKGTDTWVNNANIDWNGLEIPKQKVIGDIFSIETHNAFLSLSFETASTYGGTSFIKTGVSEAMVLDQEYHYRYRANNSVKNVVRNFITWYGQPSLPWPNNFGRIQGKDFWIRYYNRKIKIK